MKRLESENSDLTEKLIRAENNDDSARLIETREQLRKAIKDRNQLHNDK